MLALHCSWRDGLVVWAEGPAGADTVDVDTADVDAVAVDAVAGAAPAGAPRHPFAVDPRQATDAPAALARAPLGTVTIRLPATVDGPVPSPLLPTDQTAPDPDRMAPWQVPAVLLPADQALPLLAGTGWLAAGATLAGTEWRYLAQLVDFVTDLVRRGRVLPSLIPLPDADPGADDERERTVRAVWRPVVTGADAARLREFATALPPVLHAVTDPDGHTGAAGATVAGATDALTDAVVRSRLPRRRGGRRAATAAGRSPAGTGPASPVLAAWRQALTGPAEFTAPAGQVAELAAALADWERDAAGGAVRGWFRLVEPPAPDGEEGTEAAGAAGAAVPAVADPDGAWQVRLGLAAADDPSLSVDAEQVWASRGALTALARHVDAPQETYLAELGRALRLWPGLEPALRTARPTRVGLDAAGAHEFLTTAAPSLAAAGFGVLLPSWWGGPAHTVGVRAQVTTASQPAAVGGESVLGAEALVAFQWQLAIGSHQLTQEEIDALAEAKQPLVRLRGQWITLDPERLRAGVELVTSGATHRASLVDLVRAVAGEQAPGVRELPVLGIDSDGWIGDFLAGGADRQPRPVAAPEGFTGTLRPYQERGLSWLAFLESLGFGGILADDMGLGKTVQLLALLAGDDPDDGAGASLLVCPTSVVGNWQREAARFTPRLRVHVHHGSERPQGAAFTRAVAGSDLVITTYALAARDATALRKIAWRRVVLDEAQAIKNAATKSATAIRSLPARHRFAVTGTPVENRLADLWSLMQFANPGLLGAATAFRERFATPIERAGDQEAAARLRAVTQPFLLRRVKTDRTIIADLPPKLEMEVTCTLTREQASLYQAVVDDMLHRIATSSGMERRGLVLATMTKLKQVCNHPAQFLRDGSSLPGRSGKLELVEATVAEILDAGEKALLFTQYTEFGAMLRAHLSSRFGVEVAYLHGGVGRKAREELVRRFQSGEPGAPPLFLLSLKAGGTGLTLTAANHVLHVDRWWNPAVEDQASDRAYRIGQTRTVQVRKLVCAGTLEEKIAAMIAGKRELADSIVGDGDGWLTELSTEQIRELITLEEGAVVA